MGKKFAIGKKVHFRYIDFDLDRWYLYVGAVQSYMNRSELFFITNDICVNHRDAD